MDYLFPIIFASLLLIPVLYVLQTGLTKLGILAVSLLSFTFVMLVVGLNGVLPLWQDVILILLLALVISYVLETRLYRYFFVAEQENEVEENYDQMMPVTQMAESKNESEPEEQPIKVSEDETQSKQVEMSYLEELFQREETEKKEGSKI
ncbi:hypothetical protein [Ectobacillus sp. sgz5001026]|uniref:hypothetical protein n=1 Tax=Ectobacillus sp. sgz5001026 TaxID=3242473 RepID=UPI0036D2DC08